ncbi:hypothetical protein BGZ49_000067 [Haplosporangium sp. Z 27]|nr:hypothetical protein BGZ49_000067 [Haplosporangium sp. Z 27]
MKTGLRSSSNSVKNPSSFILTPSPTPQPNEMSPDTRSQNCKKTRGTRSTAKSLLSSPKKKKRLTATTTPVSDVAAIAAAVPIQQDEFINVKTDEDHENLLCLEELGSKVPDIVVESIDPTVPSSKTAPTRGRKRKSTRRITEENEELDPVPKKRKRQSTAIVKKPARTSQPRKKKATLKANESQLLDVEKAVTQSNKNVHNQLDTVQLPPRKGRRLLKSTGASVPSLPISRSQAASTHGIEGRNAANKGRSETTEPSCVNTGMIETTIVNHERDMISRIKSGNEYLGYTAPEAAAAQAMAELYRGCHLPVQESAQQAESSVPDRGARANQVLESEMYQENNEETYEDCYRLLPFRVPQEVLDKILAMQQSIYDWGFRDGMESCRNGDCGEARLNKFLLVAPSAESA